MRKVSAPSSLLALIKAAALMSAIFGASRTGFGGSGEEFVSAEVGGVVLTVRAEAWDGDESERSVERKEMLPNTQSIDGL